jgi:translocation protein SEC72
LCLELFYEPTFDSESSKVLCQAHSSEICKKCNVDWSEHNALAETLKPSNGELPPPNAPNLPRNAQVNRLREEGNKNFKAGNFPEAIRFYTMALEVSSSRPLWEPLAFQFIKEELSPVLSNRAAAYMGMKNYVDALVDAETVTKLKREWSKGWFRKGKALAGLNRTEEALDALSIGLGFDPDSEELKKAVDEIKS